MNQQAGPHPPSGAPANTGGSECDSMTARTWKVGDRVGHAGRPEWGQGEVLSAEPSTQDGKPCQRVTVRFDRGGTRSLSTAFAELREWCPAAHDDAAQSHTADVLGLNGSRRDYEEAMTRLPEPATDPFRPLKARLSATLGLYRFGPEGASLIDWAAMQSGLKDPMTRFNRHELEGLFRRFQGALDAHLRKLVLDSRKQDPAALAEALAGAPPAARNALRRLDIAR